MKRLLIVLLLVMMPFQSVWAAACACCIGDDGEIVQQTSQALDQQQASDSGDEGDDASDKPCCDSGCDLCHHLSASALPSANPDLPLPKGAPHLRGELRRFVSHIADLIPPPDRLLRA